MKAMLLSKLKITAALMLILCVLGTGMSLLAHHTLAAGQNEAKLVITVAADAPAGNRADLVVKATCNYSGQPIVTEAKFNVNVVK